MVVLAPKRARAASLAGIRTFHRKGERTGRVYARARRRGLGRPAACRAACIWLPPVGFTSRIRPTYSVRALARPKPAHHGSRTHTHAAAGCGRKLSAVVAQSAMHDGGVAAKPPAPVLAISFSCAQALHSWHWQTGKCCVRYDPIGWAGYGKGGIEFGDMACSIAAECGAVVE